jgi:hypothetical protein
MKLSTNFNLSEFTASAKASSLGISNQPSEQALACIKELVDNLLQPIRTKLGRPTKITSGYRSGALNTAIGGVHGSQHSEGKAVDFQVQGMTSREVCKFIIEMDIEFDQLIDEGTWVHISYNKGRNRNQVLTAVFTKGKPTTYKAGLFS